jgi:hypothetical protein
VVLWGGRLEINVVQVGEVCGEDKEEPSGCGDNAVDEVRA